MSTPKILFDNKSSFFTCRVYCYACLTFFIGEIGLEKIRRESIWSCFLCSTMENESKLKARGNWREHLALMFQPDSAIIPVIHILFKFHILVYKF